MTKVKQLLLAFPEYYLLIVALIAGYTPPFSFSPIFIGLAAIPLLQIIFKNKITGLLLGALFLLINLYMLGALISEFNEFVSFNASAQQLLFVGLTLWSLNMLASILMIYKYTINKNYHRSSSINIAS